VPVLRVYFRGRRSFWDPRVSIPVLIPISIGLPLTFLTLGGWVVGLPLILLALYLLFDKMGWVYVVDSEGVKVLRRGRIEGFIPIHVIRGLTVRVRGEKPRDWGRVTLGFACLFIGGGCPCGGYWT